MKSLMLNLVVLNKSVGPIHMATQIFFKSLRCSVRFMGVMIVNRYHLNKLDVILVN